MKKTTFSHRPFPVNHFPELEHVMIGTIPEKRSDYLHTVVKDGKEVEVRVVDSFREAISEFCDPEENLTLIVSAFASYLELPILIDKLSDGERKELKLKGAPALKVFLGRTKLHRVIMTGNMQLLDLFLDFIPLSDDLQELKKVIEETLTPDSPGTKSLYDTWDIGKRINFVIDVVTPFTKEVCISFVNKVVAERKK